MVKGVSAISNFGKKMAMTAIFAGITTYGASALNKIINVNSTAKTQTELVSKEAAAALKANAIAQTATEVPTKHNYKLDKKLEQLFESDSDKAECKKLLDQIYSSGGIYYGSAVIQHEIDRQMLDAFITENTNLLIKNDINPDLGKAIKEFGADFYNSVRPKKERITEWRDNKYTPNLAKDLNFDHKPTATEVCERLDYIAENKAGFTKLEKAEYFMNSDAYIKNNIKNNDTQFMSQLIAYKMYLIDKKVIEKTMIDMGVFGIGSFQKGKIGIEEYFQRWMESVDPSDK